jgi:prepilin-type processing-associated H-X9-DG protein
MELLVVMGIILLLAGILVPILITALRRSQGVRCVSNLKEIQAAMFLYAADNDDFVVWNASYLRHSWVSSGDYARSAPDARGCTNLQWLVSRENASFASYISSPQVYKCPSDKTTVKIEGRHYPWVRSYGASFLQRKMCDFDNNESLEGTPVPPSLNYTFNEPHPGYLVGLLAAGAETNAFAIYPASWHNGGAAFAFADGHAELHHWVDSRTRRPLDEDMRFGADGTAKLIPSPHNPDVHWLRQRAASGSGYGRQDSDIYHALCADPSLWIQ